MQENAQIEWTPAIIDRTTPWELKLYLLYLLVVSGIFVVRSVRLGWKLWSFRRSVQGTEAGFIYLWETCSAIVASMKRTVLLTFFLSVLICLLLAIRFLTRMSIQKSTGVAMVTGSIAEALSPLALGIAVCAVFYGVASVYEGILTRRKASWNYSRSTADNQDPRSGSIP